MNSSLVSGRAEEVCTNSTLSKPGGSAILHGCPRFSYLARPPVLRVNRGPALVAPLKHERRSQGDVPLSPRGWEVREAPGFKGLE